MVLLFYKKISEEDEGVLISLFPFLDPNIEFQAGKGTVPNVV